MPEWISVKDRLPDEREPVLIWCGECQVAKIEKGISVDERNKMKSGEVLDKEEWGWCLSQGFQTHKRSDLYRSCDEFGNNLVPWRWIANGGPMSWWGQDVSYWMPLPTSPEEAGDA